MASSPLVDFEQNDMMWFLLLPPILNMSSGIIPIDEETVTQTQIHSVINAKTLVLSTVTASERVLWIESPPS
jgi:hypothetical protein